MTRTTAKRTHYVEWPDGGRSGPVPLDVAQCYARMFPGGVVKVEPNSDSDGADPPIRNTAPEPVTGPTCRMPPLAMGGRRVREDGRLTATPLKGR